MQVKVTIRRRLGLGEGHDCEGYMETLTQVGLLQEHSCHPFTTYQIRQAIIQGQCVFIGQVQLNFCGCQCQV